MNNYYKKHQKQIEDLSYKPRLLLHVCCGPCSLYPLYYLKDHFRITVYYTNSNIYPITEYDHRLWELERYLDALDAPIELVVPKYDVSYQKRLAPYALEKEGLRRCAKCYAYRLKDSYEYAKTHNFEYFSTIMSISRHKNSDYLNYLGNKLEEEDKGPKFLFADFKKGNGESLNKQFNHVMKLYEQNYCGCLYSK